MHRGVVEGSAPRAGRRPIADTFTFDAEAFATIARFSASVPHLTLGSLDHDACSPVRGGEKVGHWSGGVVLRRGGVKPCHWLG